MNQILDLDVGRGIARVQPCVTADQLLSAYPVIGDDAHVGRSGGDRWGGGDCRVIGLEVVWPTGRIARTGGDLLAAPVAEHAFSRLLARPDGTFAVITELALALDRPQPSSHLAVAYFGSAAAACDAMRAVLDAGLLMPLSEFLERSSTPDLEARARLGLSCDAAVLLVFASDSTSPANGEAFRRICEINGRAGATHTAVATNTAWCGALLRALRELRPSWAKLSGGCRSGMTGALTSVRTGQSALVAQPSECTALGGSAVRLPGLTVLRQGSAGEIALPLTRLNNVVRIDRSGMVARVQPLVRRGRLQRALSRARLQLASAITAGSRRRHGHRLRRGGPGRHPVGPDRARHPQPFARNARIVVRWATNSWYPSRVHMTNGRGPVSLCGFPVHSAFRQRPDGLGICPDCATVFVDLAFPLDTRAGSDWPTSEWFRQPPSPERRP